MSLSLKVSACTRAMLLASAGLTVAALAVVPARASILYADTDTTLYTVNEGTGTLTQAATGFVNARGIAVDSSGTVYVADYDTGAGALGTVYSVAGGTATPLITGLTGPYGLQINSAGNLVVSTNNGLVNTYSTSGGALLSSVSVGGNLTDLGTAANGDLLVSSRSTGNVYDVSSNSVFSTALAGLAARGINTAPGASQNVMFVDETSGNGTTTGTIYELDPTSGAPLGTLYAGNANAPEGDIYDPSSGLEYYGALGNTVNAANAGAGIYSYNPAAPGGSPTLLTSLAGSPGDLISFHDLALANVPEPVSLTLLGTALIGLTGARRLRSRRPS